MAWDGSSPRPNITASVAASWPLAPQGRLWPEGPGWTGWFDHYSDG